MPEEMLDMAVQAGWQVTSSVSSFFFQAEDGIRDGHVTGVQTCALPISRGNVIAALAGPQAVDERGTRCPWRLDSTVQRTKAAGEEVTKLLTPAKLAEHLDVSTGTLANWRSAGTGPDRKSTRLNSSHVAISYAVF